MDTQFGVLSPQETELEAAILGAIIIDHDAMQTVLDIITNPETFYVETHRRIYKTMQFMFRSGEPIDLRTVTLQLKKEGNLEFVGGAYFLMTLAQQANSTNNTEYYCRVVQQAYMRRTIITIGQKLASKAYNTALDPFLILEEAQRDFLLMVDGLSLKKEESLLSLVPATLDDIDDARYKGGITGIQTGITIIDELTGGFQPSDLIILAARPGHGKTTFILNMATNSVLDYNKKVVIFSLEMSAKQLALKLIARQVELSTSHLTKGKVWSNDEMLYIRQKAQKLITESFIIEDTAGLSLNQIRAKAHKFKTQYGIDWIIIDYLQLISADVKPGGRTREQEISSISRGLKMLAKELSIPIVALSQLSRNVENRAGKRPQLSDLRESGSIEQDADMVIFMMRYACCDITQDEHGNSTDNLCEISIAKHRNGKVCINEDALIVGCHMQQSKFFNIDKFKSEVDKI